MRLTVDRNVCMRSGQCSYLHPELFREDDDGFPIVLVEHPEGEQLAAAEDAAELCPSGAIRLVEEVEGQ
jgi:ferredoxin